VGRRDEGAAAAVAVEAGARAGGEPGRRRVAPVIDGDETPVSRAMATRLQRRLAEALAHRIDGAKISYGTVIGGRRHFVVWLDDAPVQVFPADITGDLAAVPELKHFNRELLHDPPSTPPRLWHRRWWLPPGEPRLWEAEFWGRSPEAR
jgi:hypothetical protein